MNQPATPLSDHEMTGLVERVWDSPYHDQDLLLLLWMAWIYGDDGCPKDPAEYVKPIRALNEAHVVEVMEYLETAGVLRTHPDGDGSTWMVTL